MILLLAGCCVVPGTEVYRPELTVELTGEHDGLTHVVACTWSTWGPIDAGCDDVVEAARDGDAWRVPEWRSGGPFVVIMGEAPLDDTLVVTCAGGEPTGAALASWEEPDRTRLTIGATRFTKEILGKEAFGVTDEGFERQLRELCAGRGRRQE